MSLQEGPIRCQLCPDHWEPADHFAEHLDSHSDAELSRWPGGLTELDKIIQRCLQPGFAADPP